MIICDGCETNPATETPLVVSMQETNTRIIHYVCTMCAEDFVDMTNNFFEREKDND